MDMAMEHAHWLARIFGPFFLIVSIWVWCREKDIEKIWLSIRATPAISYLGGILNLLIGLTILSTYGTWSLSLAVVLPIVGWLILIRGLLVLYYQEKMMQWTIALEPYWKVLALIPFIFGLLLSIFAIIK